MVWSEDEKRQEDGGENEEDADQSNDHALPVLVIRLGCNKLLRVDLIIYIYSTQLVNNSIIFILSLNSTFPVTLHTPHKHLTTHLSWSISRSCLMNLIISQLTLYSVHYSHTDGLTRHGYNVTNVKQD